MRESIFISHATLGENETGFDNDFALWLSMQLIGMGHKVWCDLRNLKGGEDFWAEIEHEIRNNSIKYLYVLSNNSNHREGTLKELAVALKTKKQLNDHRFIIPLHIDNSLSHDDINIDLVRLNSVNFKDGWSKGLARLIDRFSDDGISLPKVTDYDSVSNIWQTIFLNGITPLEKTEIYASNWFPILKIPRYLYFHEFGNIIPLRDFPLWNSKFPTMRHKQYLASFAQYHDFADIIPDFQKYDPYRTKVYEVSQLLQKGFNDDFIKGENARNIVMQLLNIALNKFFHSQGLRNYNMANRRKAYWFEKDALEKDKINKILMVGKMKYGKDRRINWHFGVSGSARLESENFFVFSSHIIFTWNGKKLIEEDSIQHKCRRKQGKDWWNRHWRDKLLNFISHFAGHGNIIIICVGSGREEAIHVNSIPYDFHSDYGYIDPDERNLPTDEDDIESVENTEELETEPDEEEAK